MCAAVKTALEAMGILCMAKDMGIECTLNPAPCRSTDAVPGHPEGTGKVEKGRHAETRNFKRRRIREIPLDEGERSREPRRLDDTTAPRPKTEQWMKLMGHRLVKEKSC